MGSRTLIGELEEKGDGRMDTTMKLDRADAARVTWAERGRRRWATASLGCVRIDSRRVGPGDVFVALVGERHDAHAFLDDVALAAGASFAIVQTRPRARRPACLEVDDTLAALEALARRARADASARVIAITGSNGKTTTRSLVAGTVDDREAVLEPEQNFNNHIGLPLTLTRLPPRHRVAVLELGMNRPGEISHSSEIARPHVAVITNIGRAHVGPVGGIEAVRRAKMEIVDGIEPDGVVVIPASDSRLARDAAARGVEVISVGTEAHATAAACGSRDRPRARASGSAMPTVRWWNSAFPAVRSRSRRRWRWAVSASRRAFRPRPRPALERARRPRPHVGPAALGDHGARRRLQRQPRFGDRRPRHPRAMPITAGGRRIAVLGDMAELGDETEPSHRELASHFAGIDVVHVVGPFMRAAADAASRSGRRGVVHHPDRESAISALAGRLSPGDIVLFKGSRSAGLERVIAALFPAGEEELMLYELLVPLAEVFSPLNVFRYITFRASYAMMTALIISFWIGPRLIRWLDG